MGPAITGEEEGLHMLADVFEASVYLKDDLERDPTSASRAVVWLLSCPVGEEGNSAASSSLIIRQGIAQVSLVRKPSPQQSHQAGNNGVPISTLGGDGSGGGDDGKHRLWLPATVLPIDVESQGSSRGQWSQQLRNSSNTSSRNQLLLSSSSPARTASHGTSDEGNGNSERCSAFLSPCLAEALGLPAAITDNPTRPGESVGLFSAVELSIRELPIPLVAPAASVELSGPYPIVAGRSGVYIGGSQRNPRPLAQSPSPPPPSVVSAVSSILPFALEGEILSAGSVVHVAGLFGVLVTGVCAEGELRVRKGAEKRGDEESERTRPSSMSNGDGGGGGDAVVVKAHVATELCLLPPSPPTRARPRGVALGGQASAAASAAASGGGIVAVAAAAAVSLTSCDSGPSNTTQQWCRRVERDFGGQADKVAAAVATVQSALWGTGDGRADDSSRMGWGLASPSSGLLLHGPTGVGKTLLVRLVEGSRHSSATSTVLS